MNYPSNRPGTVCLRIERFSKLAGALLIILATLVVPLMNTTPVVAAPAIASLSTPSGTVGASVTLTGTIDTASASFEVHWDSAPGTVLRSGASNASKNVTATFPIPDSYKGTHNVYLRDVTANTFSPAQPIYIDSSIMMTPTGGPVGTTINVTGLGWGPYENGIVLTYDNSAVGSGISASASGYWTFSFQIPDSASGTGHLVDAYSTSTLATSINDLTLNVGPTITMSANTGVIGTSITLSGRGFRSNDIINITWDSTPIVTNISGTSSGTWTGNFQVPESPYGTHTVSASGTYTPASEVQGINFTTMPKVNVSPTSGITGTPVTVTATGFGSNETGIRVMFGSEVIKDGITANSKGSFTATFNVPAGAGGSYPVTISASSTPTTSLQAFTFGVAARITANLNTGTVGSKVTVTGTSFGASETGITILYDAAATGAGPFTANASGDWSGTFSVPPSASGVEHRITAQGSRTQAATVTPMPFTVTPEMTVNPTAGFVGTTVTMTGTGFGASKPLTITYDGAALTTNPSPAATSPQGGFTVTFAAPKSKGGEHSITLTEGANPREFKWAMDSTPPPLPSLNSPGNGERIGYLGPDQVILRWSEVTDPSGVCYTIQMSTTADFASPFINKQNLTTTTYTSEALEFGTYFWRVKAIDNAFNESAWTAANSVQVGYMPPTAFWALVGVAVLGIAGGAFLGIRTGRKKLTFDEKPVRKPKSKRRRKDEEEEEGVPEPGLESIPLPAEAEGEGPASPQPEDEEETPEPAVAEDEAEAEPEPPPPSDAEVEAAVTKAVIGLTDADVTQVAQRPDLRALGLHLAKIYKLVARIEKEGKLVRDQKGRYQLAGKKAPAGKPEDFEMPETMNEGPVAEAGPFDEETTPAAKPPPPAPSKRQPVAETRPVKDSRALREEKPVKKARKEEEPEAAPEPVARATPTPEPKESKIKRPEPEPAPELIEPRPSKTEVIDEGVEQMVMEAITGLSDADVPQVAQHEHIRARGLNLARIYKLCSKLEKEGKLIRDEKGRYQRAGGKEQAAPVKSKAKETELPDWSAEMPQPEKPPPPKHVETPKPSIASELEEVAAETIIGSTDVDIPQLAQLPDIRNRGLNLAKLYQIAGKLEKEGRLVRDNKGRYQRGADKTAPPVAEDATDGVPVARPDDSEHVKASPKASTEFEDAPEEEASQVPEKGARRSEPRPLPAGKRASSLEWSGRVHWQEWESFYAKVLSRYIAEESLALNISFQVQPKNGVSLEKIEDTRESLKELILSEDLDVGPALDKPGPGGVPRHARMAWTGAVPWHDWNALFAKVLSRFLADDTLEIGVAMKVQPKAGVSDEKVEETREALENLNLGSALTLG